jgi:hypothetical protein
MSICRARSLVMLLVCTLTGNAFALNGDPRPDAPELAARGPF